MAFVANSEVENAKSSKNTTLEVEPDNHSEQLCDFSRVLTRQELITLLTELPRKLGLLPQPHHRGRTCIGMVGFPNVGKSSVINTVLGVSKSVHGK